MKTLQSNFTTSEQSKQLLELGVPSDSADCYLTRFGIDEGWEAKILNNVKYLEIAISNQKYCLPCWSVGRLIEIAKICSKSRYALRGLFLFLDECEADECMSQVMDYFEICNYQFDFLKLEE